MLRCLIIDDSPEFLDAARRLLRLEGIDVVGVASTGPEALRLARELRPDVTLVDIVLGPEDGIALARRLVESDGGSAGKVILVHPCEDEFADLIQPSRPSVLQRASPRRASPPDRRGGNRNVVSSHGTAGVPLATLFPHRRSMTGSLSPRTRTARLRFRRVSLPTTTLCSRGPGYPVRRSGIEFVGQRDATDSRLVREHRPDLAVFDIRMPPQHHGLVPRADPRGMPDLDRFAVVARELRRLLSFSRAPRTASAEESVTVVADSSHLGRSSGAPGVDPALVKEARRRRATTLADLYRASASPA